MRYAEAVCKIFIRYKSFFKDLCLMTLITRVVVQYSMILMSKFQLFTESEEWFYWQK